MTTWEEMEKLEIPDGISSTGSALPKPEIRKFFENRNRVEQYQVMLTPQMIALCMDVGNRRQGIKDEHGISGSNYASPEESNPARFHQRGVASEIAVAALLDVQPDLRIFAHGTRGINLRYKDLRISIKHNSRSWGDLRFEPGRVPNVDYIIMTTGDYQAGSLLIVGWISRDQFMAKAQIKDLPGQGERLLLSQHQLAPMDHLLYELGILDKPIEQLDLFAS